MRAQPKKGGLGARTASKKRGGVLGAGTARKRGVLGPGVLGTSTTRKGGNLELFFVKREVLGSKVGQKWILGAYLFIILTSICQHDQLHGGGVFWQAKKMGGLRCGSCCSTKGVLGGGSNSTPGTRQRRS